MGNQPGGARMDPSNMEPASPSRWKERQEVPARTSLPQESTVTAQEILSNVVNRATEVTSAGPLALLTVGCDESVTPGTDLKESTMNRTLTKEELEALCSPEPRSSEPASRETIQLPGDQDLNEGLALPRRDSARGKPSAGTIDVTFVSPSELEDTFVTSTDQSLFFDALSPSATVDAQPAGVKPPSLPGKPFPFPGAPSEPLSEPVRLSAEGLHEGDEEPASICESPRAMNADETLVIQHSQSPQLLLRSPPLSHNGSDLYDKNVNLVLIEPSLGESESPSRTAPQDCNDNLLVFEQTPKEEAVATRSSLVAADGPADLLSVSPLAQQVISRRQEKSLLATAQHCNDNHYVAPNEDGTAAHGGIRALSRTLADKEGTTALEVKKHPEVDILPEEAEKTDVCTGEPQPQDSEAGPEVAQFSREELLPVAANIKDSADLDFFQKVGTSRHLRKTFRGRRSIFRTFDPLSSCSPDRKEEEEPKEQQSSSRDDQISRALDNSADRLIDFVNSPPLKEELNSTTTEGTEATEHMFSEKEMTQALKYQELMFQERLLKKDQDYMKEQERLREEVDSLRAKLEHSNSVKEQLEKTVSALVSHNEQMVSAIERHQLGKKKDSDERTSALEMLTKERDQLVGDLQNMEIAFGDFHRRYEKAKQVISTLKENESILKQQLAECREGVEKSHQMFNVLKTKTEESLEGASKELEDAKKNLQADITVLRGQLKKAEMDNSCLEKRLEQKTEENVQLAKLYDDLLSQVKAN